MQISKLILMPCILVQMGRGRVLTLRGDRQARAISFAVDGVTICDPIEISISLADARQLRPAVQISGGGGSVEIVN